MNERGVVYVAYGSGAKREAGLSIETLKRHHRWPIRIITEDRFKDETGGTPGRYPKVNLYNLSPFKQTLFLDADTRVFGDLSVGFDLLAQGYDLVMVPSRPQGEAVLGHLTEAERDYTFAKLGEHVLQLNTGVMWFRRSEPLTSLFQLWKEEWWRFKDQDQGALLRALDKQPVKVFLLGRAYNGGVIVQHRFGACKRS